MALVAEVGRSLRTLGGFAGALDLAARALARLTRGRCRLVHYLFVAQQVPPAARERRPDGTARVREAGPDDPLVAAFPRPPAVNRRRFAAGATCLVATAGERFAGHLWVQQRRYDEDEVRCVYLLPEDAAWDFDVYVEPAFRMGRTFVRLWEAANALLRSRGVAWSFSRIAAANVDSLRAHQRFRTLIVARGVFVVAGRAQLALLSRAPYVHLSLRAAPVLRFASPRPDAPP